MKADEKDITAEAPLNERITYLRSRLLALNREHKSLESMAEEDPFEAHRLYAQLNADIDEIQELIGGLGDTFKAIDLQVGAFLSTLHASRLTRIAAVETSFASLSRISRQSRCG